MGAHDCDAGDDGSSGFGVFVGWRIPDHECRLHEVSSLRVLMARVRSWVWPYGIGVLIGFALLAWRATVRDRTTSFFLISAVCVPATAIVLWRTRRTRHPASGELLCVVRAGGVRSMIAAALTPAESPGFGTWLSVVLSHSGEGVVLEVGSRCIFLRSLGMCVVVEHSPSGLVGRVYFADGKLAFVSPAVGNVRGFMARKR